MIWLVSLVMTGALGGSPGEPGSGSGSVPTTVRPVSAVELLAAESRRVRSNNDRIIKLLNDGVRRSRTFADLVTKIHASNVIVYVEPSNSLPIGMAGRILLQTTAGHQRYLRIQVRGMLTSDHLISIIGHELRHAVEVAADESVVDDAGLKALYKRIGHMSNGTRGFDTDAAQDAGRKVRDELVG
jgi:hypothetical protein